MSDILMFESDFVPTAQVLLEIHPDIASATGAKGDAESLAQWAMAQTRALYHGRLAKPGYWSTAGFVVALYSPAWDPETLHCKVSVCPHVLMSYLTRQKGGRL